MNQYPTFEARKRATETLIGWIEQVHGQEVAYAWAWECTPIPCGLPDDQMLDDGLSLVLGEVTIGELRARAYREMLRQASEYPSEESK